MWSTSFLVHIGASAGWFEHGRVWSAALSESVVWSAGWGNTGAMVLWWIGARQATQKVLGGQPEQGSWEESRYLQM